MLFTKKKAKYQPAIYMGKTKLKWVAEVKYLGLMIDNKLSWAPHMAYLYTKTNTLLFNAKGLVTKKFGASPLIMKWLLTNVIHPMITYACIVWGHRVATTKTRMQKLRRVCRLAMMLTTGCGRSVPQVALEMLLGIDCIENVVRQNCLHQRERMVQNGHWNPGEATHKGHRRWANTLAQEVGLHNMPNEQIKDQVICLPTFQTHIPERHDFAVETTNPDPQIIHIWTDGSKDALGNAGAAYIIKSREKSHRHQEIIPLGEASVYQCEAMALIGAADHLREANMIRKKLLFYTDNQAVILALQAPFDRSHFIRELKLKLNFLNKKNQVVVGWVPGHANHWGNEIADRLAKRAADLSPSLEGPRPIIPVDPEANHRIIKKWAEGQHHNKWRETTHAATLHLLSPAVGQRWKEGIIRWGRGDLRTFTNTVTGQTGLKKLLHAAGVEEDPGCECGAAVESNLHFLTACDIFALLRQQIFGLSPLPEASLHLIPLIQILKFIKRTKRFTYRPDQPSSQEIDRL